LDISIVAQDIQDTQYLLYNLFSQVKAQEGTLAGGTKLGIGATALQELRETKVAFGNPRNDLIKLTPDLFKEIGVTVTERLKQQMEKQFDFYYITLIISMRSGEDVEFRQMECELQFGPKGRDEPIIHTIFPTNKWRDLLKGGIGISLALDGDLDWRAGIDLSQVAKAWTYPAQ